MKSLLTTLIVLVLVQTARKRHVTGQRHTDVNFNCTSGESLAVIRVSDITSGTITSPCYPADYTQCRDFVSPCYRRFSELPSQMWIGIFILENSVIDTNDHITLHGLCNTTQRGRFPYPPNGVMCSDYIDDKSRYFDIGFIRTSRISSSRRKEYKFMLEYRIAHVISQDWHNQSRVSASLGDGFIVSHSQFNYENSTIQNANSVLTLTELYGNKTLLSLTFLFFELYHHQFVNLPQHFGCTDYLEISGVEGYKGNALRYCGYDSPTNITVVPANGNVTWRFVTSRMPSAGFLIKYKVLEIECDIPRVPADGYMDISLNSESSPRAQVTILYQCHEGYELATTINLAICQSNGTWSSAAPNCRRPITLNLAMDTFELNNTSGKCKKANMSASEMSTSGVYTRSMVIYLGIGNGTAIILIAVIIIIMFVLIHRRNGCKTCSKNEIQSQEVVVQNHELPAALDESCLYAELEEENASSAASNIYEMTEHWYDTIN